MRVFNEQRKYSGYLEGILLGITPLPFLFPFALSESLVLSFNIRVIAAVTTSALLLIAHFILSRYPRWGKFCLLTALASGVTALLPKLMQSPYLTLASLLICTLIWGATYALRPLPKKLQMRMRKDLRRRRAIGIAIVQFVTLLAFAVKSHAPDTIESQVILTICALAHICDLHCSLHNYRGLKRGGHMIWDVAALLILFWGYLNGCLLDIATILAICPHILSTINILGSYGQGNSSWMNMLINSPAKMIPTSFVLLILGGTLLLCLPLSTYNGILPLDALFTATSAVSGTGLTTVDVSSAFTTSGKIVIMMLIQIGALGIMTFSPIVLHFFGRRVNVCHEKAINSLVEADDQEDIFKIVGLIIKFTFAVEFVGAFLLSVCFIANGVSIGNAIWEAIFTSVSSFCSAGFSLYSDNLTSFRHNQATLSIITALVFLGSTSPIAAMFIPQWIRGRQIPAFPKSVLVTTTTVIGIGFLVFLASEWDNLLGDFTITDKLTNALFQTTSARAAGFNSLDMQYLNPLSYTLYLILMFAGGSPGSTGGGIKTSVVAILMINLWDTLVNRQKPTVRNRSISADTLSRCIVIFTAYMCFQCIIIFLLAATQSQPLKGIIFEAFSALATVGLSMNITPELNAIGKAIVIVTMFVGRVGASILILRMASNEDETVKITYPNAHLPFT